MGRQFGFNEEFVWGGILPDGLQVRRTGKYLEARGTFPFIYHHQHCDGGDDYPVHLVAVGRHDYSRTARPAPTPPTRATGTT